MNVKQMQLDMKIPAVTPDHVRNAYIAKSLMEHSSGEARLMESICESQNLLKALKRVESNDGVPGIDGMKCHQLSAPSSVPLKRDYGGWTQYTKKIDLYSIGRVLSRYFLEL